MTDQREGESERLAPVIPLFGARASVPDAPAEAPPVDRASDAPDAAWAVPGLDRADTDASSHEPVDVDTQAERDAAEHALVKKLRVRSLSLREARAVLVERDLPDDDIDAVLATCARHGYLDDARLAEQLIHTAVERKGQGRRAASQTLSQRGIPREVIEAVMAGLPDDEAERALEFARKKAASMRDLDRDTALRRLAGQLARRGYGGSLDVARQALDEVSGGTGARSSVRFE